MDSVAVIPACDLIIFGTKGDLSRRKLLPSLYRLEKINYLHADTRIIGVGRADWDKTAYSEVVKQALETFLNEPIDEQIWQRFESRLSFCKLDVTETQNFSRLTNYIEQDKRTTISYFAMPPVAFGTICEGLAFAKLNTKNSRIVMEKPLGTNLKSSQTINQEVLKYFSESQIYRIDHYLGKETVLNLLALRFSNSLFSTIWDRNLIDHVQITIAEEVGIEGRWGYFDQTGQMRDMVQNHLLQILTMIAMAPPINLEADTIRDEKVKVLQSLRPITMMNINENTVRGQYNAGFVQGKRVPAYTEEEGANTESKTETFVAIKVEIDNWRWAGVPFYLRTGKRLPSKCSEVVIYFKNPPINLFNTSYKQLPPNCLTIRLQPDEGIDIEILNKVPGLDHKHRLQKSKLDLSFKKTFKEKETPEAYERLLYEIMKGNQSLFVRRDEVEAAWKWVDSIMQAWEDMGEAPKPYQAGTWGPIASIALMTKDGRNWNDFE